MFCQKCGKEVTGKFCTNCGNSTQNNVNNSNQAKVPVKKPIYKKWWFWLLIILFIGIIAPKENSNQNNNDVKLDEQNLQIQTKPENVEDIDYISLYNNSEEYTDKWVRISGKIESKDTNIAKINFITFREGFEGLTNVIYINISPNLDENYSNFNSGDYITVVGQVGTKTLGTLNLNNSYIEYGGNESKNIYDNYRKQEEEAKQAEIKKQKDDFIKTCQTYSYKELARDPQKFEGKNVKLKGKVIQVSENTFGNGIVLRINITKDSYGFYSDTIYCDYTYLEGESKILEDDIVTLYGVSKGDTSYTSVLGQKITLPHIAIKYIEVN